MSDALDLGNLSGSPVSLTGTIVSSLGSLAAFLVIVFFLAAPMLLEAPRWNRKMSIAFGAGQDELEDSLKAVASRVRRYLLVRAGTGIITASLYGAWLTMFGVPFILTWMLLTFLLNFVPNFGSLIAGLLPVAFAFLTLDPVMAFVVAIGLLVIEQIMGNYVDPRLQGRTLRPSALAILITLLFWTWVWGVAGALLATPIAMLVPVAAWQWSVTRPIALLLSDGSEEAV